MGRNDVRTLFICGESKADDSMISKGTSYTFSRDGDDELVATKVVGCPAPIGPSVEPGVWGEIYLSETNALETMLASTYVANEMLEDIQLMLKENFESKRDDSKLICELEKIFCVSGKCECEDGSD